MPRTPEDVGSKSDLNYKTYDIETLGKLLASIA